MKKVKTINKVYVFANNMVAVFDENGEQIPEYQGYLPEVEDKIREAAPNIVFKVGELK